MGSIAWLQLQHTQTFNKVIFLIKVELAGRGQIRGKLEIIQNRPNHSKKCRGSRRTQRRLRKQGDNTEKAVMKAHMVTGQNSRDKKERTDLNIQRREDNKE